jgi:hypothetical protein
LRICTRSINKYTGLRNSECGIATGIWAYRGTARTYDRRDSIGDADGFPRQSEFVRIERLREERRPAIEEHVSRCCINGPRRRWEKPFSIFGIA